MARQSSRRAGEKLSTFIVLCLRLGICRKQLKEMYANPEIQYAELIPIMRKIRKIDRILDRW